MKRILSFFTLTVILITGSLQANEPSIWDGSSRNKGWYSETETEFTIMDADQLAGLAELVLSGITFEGSTITLINDIDLAEETWSPIGYFRSNGSNAAFKG